MRASSTLVAAVIAACALVAVTAVPARAHDELIASDPAAAQRLAAAPGSVSLSFSAEVLTIGAAVVVVDDSGQDWVDGPPKVREGVVTATLAPGMPDAGYEVRWRVVSSDGHPISGIVPFTVGEGRPLVRNDAASDAGGAASTESEQSTQENRGALRVLLVGGAGAAIAAALFSLFLFLRRRARDDDPEAPRT